MRAKLELAIDKVLREVNTAEARQSSNSDYASESDEVTNDLVWADNSVMHWI